MRNWLPVMTLLYSAFFWGIVWYPLRLLEQGGLAGVWQVFISGSAAFIVLLPYLVKNSIDPRHRFDFLLLAVASGWANMGFVLAMLEGTVMRVMLLFYLSPVWTVLLGHWMLREHISLKTVGLMAVAMLGAMLMLWDPSLGHPLPQSTADWLAITAGIGFALNNVAIRKLHDQSLMMKSVFAWGGVVVVALIALQINGIPPLEASAEVILGAIVLGVGGLLLATFALQYGVARMPVNRSAVILLFELVVGGISAALLANELLSVREFIGGALIMVAGYFVAVWEESPENV